MFKRLAVAVLCFALAACANPLTVVRSDTLQQLQTQNDALMSKPQGDAATLLVGLLGPVLQAYLATKPQGQQTAYGPLLAALLGGLGGTTGGVLAAACTRAAPPAEFAAACNSAPVTAEEVRAAFVSCAKFMVWQQAIAAACGDKVATTVATEMPK